MGEQGEIGEDFFNEIIRCPIPNGVAFSLPDRCRYASRSEPVSRYAANASYAGSLSVVRLSQGRWVSVIRRALLLVNHDLQILLDGPAFGGRAGRVVRDHAGGFPVAGQHDFRGGRAARRQF